jgi:hypothetical protein
MGTHDIHLLNDILRQLYCRFAAVIWNIGVPDAGRYYTETPMRIPEKPYTTIATLFNVIILTHISRVLSSLREQPANQGVYLTNCFIAAYVHTRSLSQPRPVLILAQ